MRATAGFGLLYRWQPHHHHRAITGTVIYGFWRYGSPRHAAARATWPNGHDRPRATRAS